MLESAQISPTSIDFHIDEFYSSKGPLADLISDFRERPEQKEMAKSVLQVLELGNNLIVEAGTGTGKSLAYLAPLSKFSLASERPVIVSTNTINLQQQLNHSDAPLIEDLFQDSFRFSLLKGRSNYLCPRRLRKTYQRRHVLFPESKKQKDLEKLAEWHEHTQDGTLSDIDWNLSTDVWNKVNAKQGICRCLNESTREPCYYAQSRMKLQNTNLIIVNHHLFMQDLALRIETDFGILPDYAAVVIDEAHNLESVARKCLGLQITYLQFNYLIRDLYHPDKDSGFLKLFDAEDLGEQIISLDRKVEDFFQKVRDWYAQEKTNGGACRVYSPNMLPNTLAGPLNQVLKTMRETKRSLKLDEDDEREFQSLIDRMSKIKMELEDFLQQSRPEDVYWVERSEYRDNVTLRSSRVNVAPILKEQFFNSVHSTVLTSATLTTGSSEPFAYLQQRLGAEEADVQQLGHPFDYKQQATIRLTPQLPAPNENETEYIEAINEWLEDYLLKRGGDAFVLFTSYRVLNRVADRMRVGLETQGYQVLIQGRDQPRHKLLKRFQSQQPAVLFGAQSFWEGVDVPGSNLRHVIITRLPFPNPSDPLTEATSEYIENKGGNPFFDLYLPEAILRLKQGFGRLIRHRDDEGEVSILDSRIMKKSYGSQFLKALPRCKIIQE